MVSAAEIRQHVLLEAQHRCAVCGTPSALVVAGEFAQSGENNADELICVCSACRTKVSAWNVEAFRGQKKQSWLSRQPVPRPLTRTMDYELGFERSAEVELAKEFQHFVCSAVTAFLGLLPGTVRVIASKTEKASVSFELPEDSVHKLLSGYSDEEFHRLISPFELRDITSFNRLQRELLQRPFAFQFFQAVRLLSLHTSLGETYQQKPVGLSCKPIEEVVRFRSPPSLRFPPNEICEYQWVRPETDNPRLRCPDEMMVYFMGLTGPQGVMPQHYSQAVIDQEKVNHHSLRDFLDLFNHRIISLFYRAWEKSKLPVTYERHRLTTHDTDDFTQSIYSFVGMGKTGLRKRLDVDDELFIFYSGQFSRPQPNLISLERMLEEHFRVSVEVIPCVGEWLMLELEDQTTVGKNNGRLGKSAVVGDRVWGIEGRFWIRIGPLGLAEYRRYMPGRDCYREMSQVVRMYVGAEFRFDIQPVLRASEVPQLQLNPSQPPHLGWNTWALCGQRDDDVDDALFACSGIPVI